MPFTACRIVEVDTMDSLPGGPRVECLCQPGILIQVGHYAQHVANAVSKDLIERCVQAEHGLGEKYDAALELGRQVQQVDPIIDTAMSRDKARIRGKREGVALVRSYVEEVPRGE